VPQPSLHESLAQQDAVLAKIAAQHGANVKMLQHWIALPSAGGGRSALRRIHAWFTRRRVPC
jgi:hypothetical protein